MRIFILLMCCLTCNTNAVCQKDKFDPGYYITLNADTVKGYGKIKKVKNQVESLAFKSDPDSEIIIELPAIACKEISFGKESYVAWQGKRSMEFLDKMDLTLIRYNDTYKTERIYLKMIYADSTHALYKYSGEKDQFFLRTGDLVEELIMSYDYLTEWEKRQIQNTQQIPAYYARKTYQSQIFVAMKDKIDSRKKSDLLYATEYDHYSLVKLFKKLNK